MRSTNGRVRLAMASLTVMAAMVAGGCSGSEAVSSKAGGVAPPVALHMGSIYGDLNALPAVQSFVSRVRERSGGTPPVEVTSTYGDYAVDVEQQVVRVWPLARWIWAGPEHECSTPWGLPASRPCRRPC